ncbi:unnamed protein product [Ascophyllum nodosum]
MISRRGTRLEGTMGRILNRCISVPLRSRASTAKSSSHYDLVVIGSGPAAQKCALESVKYGKRVCIIDKNSLLGGVCVHTGTIPSKTFREAVLHLTGWRHQGFYGRSSQTARAATSFPDILTRVQKVEENEMEVVRDQLQREGVEIISGTARFVAGGAGERLRVMVLRTRKETESKTSVYRHMEASLPRVTISADRFLVACGTRPLRPPDVPFDGSRVFDSDQLLWGGVSMIPRDLIVIGAGVIGMEYASMISIVPGTTVTVIDPRDEVLEFADQEVIQALRYSMRRNGTRFLMREKLKRIEKSQDGKAVTAHLMSGKRVHGDAMLYAMGRLGNTDSLNLQAIGVTPGARGLLDVDDSYQTPLAGVYACGDVIGYPALASTSMEQGTMAAHHMWSSAGAPAAAYSEDAVPGQDQGQKETVTDEETENNNKNSSSSESVGGSSGDVTGDSAASSVLNVIAKYANEGKALGQAIATGTSGDEKDEIVPVGVLDRSSELLFPYGIYTVPEISMVGKTEDQLTRAGVNYEVGLADYRELAKGQMLGGVDGFLKLLFDTKTLKLLGVHAIGEGATEIIHIGQVVMSQGGSIDYFRTAVFNYPTLAEAYNQAARDGLRKVGTV